MLRSRTNRRFSIESLERRELMTADPGWAFAVSGPTGFSDSEVNLGPDGNLYVTGSYRGTIDLDPGPGVKQFTAYENAQDAFIAKYTPERGLIWAKSFGTTLSGNIGQEYSKVLKFDAAGNLYLTGYSNSTAPQFGSLTIGNNGDYDAFVAKVNSATGDFLWAHNIGGTGSDLGGDLAVSPAGDVYLAGRYANTVDFDPHPASTFELTSAGDLDAFFMKLDTNGEFEWARGFGGPTLNNGHRIVLDDAGAAYVGGTFRETTDFGSPGNPLVLEDSSPGFANLFMVKLDGATGDSLWAQQAEGTGDVSGTRMLADSGGGVVLAGQFAGDVAFGPGTSTFTSSGSDDVFVSRWDSAGNLMSAISLANGAGDVTFGTLERSADGALLLTFAFDGTADFDPGAGVAHLTSTDQTDGALVKLTADGQFTWVRQISGPGYTEVHGVIDDQAGNLYLSGEFQNSASLTTGDVVTNIGNSTYISKIAVAAPTKFFVVDGTADNTHEYDAAGNRADNYALTGANSNPRGAASNLAGDKVWVVDANKKVYVYDNSGGLLGSWTANGLSSPQGITTNGTDLWIVDSSTDRVYKYTGAASRLSGSQSAASNFKLNNQNGNATDLVTDGANVWTVNSAATDKVFRYSMTGSLQGSWTIDTRSTSPTGITLDPASPSTLWIVDNATDQVFAYAGATTRTSGSQAATIAVNLGLGNSDPQGIADPPALAEAALFEVLDDAFAQRAVGRTQFTDARQASMDRAADYLFGAWATPGEAVTPKRWRRA